MFRDRLNRQFAGASKAEMERLHRLLFADIGVSAIQIVESVAYSMAMVIRAALGLTAEAGSIAVIYSDSLRGWIALAAARHLFNAGCATHLVQFGEIRSPSETLTQLKKPLHYLRIHDRNFMQLNENHELQPFLGSCHNVVCGVAPDTNLPAHLFEILIQTLNDNSIPVHTIEAPLGIDLDCGMPGETPLFASSTLSLGIPYAGLAPGAAYVGRHYLADISLPHTVIEKIFGNPFPMLFAEQPVIQIFPVGAETE